MEKERLGLSELKNLGKSLGHTNIQREVKGAPLVRLADWNGVSPEGATGYSYVGVLYSLDGSRVIAHKPGEPDIYYHLS